MKPNVNPVVFIAAPVWSVILLLFVVACSDFAELKDNGGLSNRDVFHAYQDIDELADEVAELSSPPAVIDPAQKGRIGISLRKAKSLVDQARDDVIAGATESVAYDEARAIIDDVSIEVADLVQAQEFDE